MREFVEDLKDSFQNILSATTITSWKEPVVVATTGNITLSGEQTIDGVLTSNDRVLVRAQTDASENGIYVSAAGAWSRATDADSAAELEGAAVGVQQGSTYADAVFLQTTDSITLGTSDIEWQQIGFGSATPSLAEVLGVANDADGNAIENLADPTNAQDAATKAFVEAQLVDVVRIEEPSFTLRYGDGTASITEEHTDTGTGFFQGVIHDIHNGPNNTTYYCEATVVVTEEGGNTGGAMKIAGVFHKNNSGVVAQIGSTTTIVNATEDITGSLAVTFAFEDDLPYIQVVTDSETVTFTLKHEVIQCSN